MSISRDQARHWFRYAGYQLLPIASEHAAAVAQLPDHHRDPFDRMPVAQATTEPQRLLTHDPLVLRYGDVAIAV